MTDPELSTLPADAKRPLLVGRAWRAGAAAGPSVVVLRHGIVVDISAHASTMAGLLERADAADIARNASDPLPQAERHSLTFSSEIAQAVNYYVINAGNMESVIAGYRHLTGQAPMMPKWAYGYWQSRQRYETQGQILGAVSACTRMTA